MVDLNFNLDDLFKFRIFTQQIYFIQKSKFRNVLQTSKNTIISHLTRFMDVQYYRKSERNGFFFLRATETHTDKN